MWSGEIVQGQAAVTFNLESPDGDQVGCRDGGPGGALTSAPSRVLGVILFTLGFFVFESKRTIVPGPGGGGFDPDPGGPGGERVWS